MKDYLSSENARNKAHAASFTKLMQLAFGDCQCFIGHHLSFEQGGDLSTENEIPSADCLLFDVEVMTKVFGPNDGRYHMVTMATMPCEQRDKYICTMLDRITNPTPKISVEMMCPDDIDAIVAASKQGA